MSRAIRYLSEHYLDQPRLEDAAEAAGLSQFHFQREFTRYVGVSPKSFVGHLTLGHAKEELAQGASVLDAALEAGLSGPSRLHDLCLKIEAMTPGDYAKAGRDVDIEYGFHVCHFGIALVMMTNKGVCGLGFGDDGEEEAMFEDMKARWPKANYRENPSVPQKSRADLRYRTARRSFFASHGDAMANESLGSAAVDPIGQARDLSQDCRTSR